MHIQGLIDRVFRDAPELSSGQRSILTTLKDNAISIFKTPISEGNVDASIREEILRNTAAEYAEDVNVKFALSDECSTTIFRHYNELSRLCRQNIVEACATFKESIERFSSQCQDTALLHRVVGKLSDVRPDLPLQEVLDRCREMARSCGGDLQLRGLGDVAATIESIKFLEQFIDERSKILFDAVRSVQSQVTESKIFVEAAIKAIEIKDAQARAVEEARRKAIADEQARQAEIARQRAIEQAQQAETARQKAEAAAAATLARQREIERQTALAKQQAETLAKRQEEERIRQAEVTKQLERAKVITRMQEDLTWIQTTFREVTGPSPKWLRQWPGHCDRVPYRGSTSFLSYFLNEYPRISNCGGVFAWKQNYEQGITKLLHKPRWEYGEVQCTFRGIY